LSIVLTFIFTAVFVEALRHRATTVGEGEVGEIAAASGMGKVKHDDGK